METKTNDGGPAFPAQPIYRDPSGDTITCPQGGMSLRDYFAAQALTGWVSDPATREGHADEAARICYRFADAMLRARQSGGAAGDAR